MCVDVCDSYQRKSSTPGGPSLCVSFGDHKYEAKVIQGSDDSLKVQFGELNFLGGGNYTSTINTPTELSVTGECLLGEALMNLTIGGRNVTVQVRASEGFHCRQHPYEGCGDLKCQPYSFSICNTYIFLSLVHGTSG